jgi:ribonuclease T1
MPIVPVVIPTAQRRLLALVVPLLAVVLAACGATAAGTSASVATAPASTSAAGSLAPAQPTTDLRTVVVAKLPAEAVGTLRLIASDGPYPFAKDGATFSNREGLLPRHSSGWYREFTVVTPGSGDRGARRIIAGQDGSRFYTSDHYASFREVVSGEGS